MSPNLKELIENNVVSEMEVVEFLATLKKLSQNNVLDDRNYQMVLDHFGMKIKNEWIIFDDDVKYKLDQ
jgi:hypothetical protein